ncbi:tetratricopeptide repeat protein [Rhodohalobacter sp. 614A]|uniref:tetratricopeptide repeat protein n=1 Tax=Rhodohalobacter sp. 614A TaxID=2908649 RepID=UPI001F3D89F0|nr:hypothetical protein [Rhodohalobacter sp. 614A]
MTSQPTSIKTKIHDFVDGNLAENEVDELWAQLIGRPDDLDYLQTLATLKKMGNEGKFDHLYDTEPNVIPLSAARSKEEAVPTFYEKFKPYLVAASVLIIGFAILFNLLVSVQQPQTTGAISMIEYEIERGVDNQTILDNYLQEAVSLATNGSLEAAFSQLDQASTLNLTPNQVIDLQMVRGAIQYNSQNYSDALQTFENINLIEEIDRLSLEKSTWYLANTQLQLGMIDEARNSMQEVIELDGSFSRVAKQKLQNLSNPNS